MATMEAPNPTLAHTAKGAERIQTGEDEEEHGGRSAAKEYKREEQKLPRTR